MDKYKDLIDSREPEMVDNVKLVKHPTYKKKKKKKKKKSQIFI